MDYIWDSECSLLIRNYVVKGGDSINGDIVQTTSGFGHKLFEFKCDNLVKWRGSVIRKGFKRRGFFNNYIITRNSRVGHIYSKIGDELGIIYYLDNGSYSITLQDASYTVIATSDHTYLVKCADSTLGSIMVDNSNAKLQYDTNTIGEIEGLIFIFRELKARRPTYLMVVVSLALCIFTGCGDKQEIEDYLTEQEQTLLDDESVTDLIKDTNLLRQARGYMDSVYPEVEYTIKEISEIEDSLMCYCVDIDDREFTISSISSGVQETYYAIEQTEKFVERLKTELNLEDDTNCEVNFLQALSLSNGQVLSNEVVDLLDKIVKITCATDAEAKVVQQLLEKSDLTGLYHIYVGTEEVYKYVKETAGDEVQESFNN